MVIILDLDEVLADFFTPAMELHGILPGSHWATLRNFGLTDAEFWQPIIAGGEDFWRNIQPFSWAAEILDMVRPYDWYVVTQPGNYLASYYGKLQWLHDYFGGEIDHCTVTRKPKHLFANPDTLLIDDYYVNCEKFSARGGRVIQFPARHNHLRDKFNNPIPYLKEEFSKCI